MKITPWMVLICLGIVGCSGSKSAKKVSESSPQIELSDADQFIGNPTEAAPEEAAVVDELGAADPLVTESEEPVVVTNEPAESLNNNFEAGATKQYHVGKNETLMLVAPVGTASGVMIVFDPTTTVVFG